MYYPGALEFARELGDRLAGKVVVDIANPLNQTFEGLTNLHQPGINTFIPNLLGRESWALAPDLGTSLITHPTAYTEMFCETRSGLESVASY